MTSHAPWVLPELGVPPAAPVGPGQVLVRRDRTGLRFHRLTVVERAADYVNPNGTQGARWLCLCECGQTVTLRGTSLTGAGSRSCGCLRKELVSERSLRDRTGQRFGRLVVLGRAEDYVAPSGRRLVRWLCLCDCGERKVVMVGSLTSGKARSCGCLQRELTSDRKLVNLVGQTFGRLTVTGRAPNKPNQTNARWVCVCSCPTRTSVVTSGDSLVSEHTRSCGCLQREVNSALKTKEMVGYAAAHQRVSRVRGSASTYACVDCGDPAKQWSYVGACSAERVHTGNHNDGSAYCQEHLACYEPRCSTCHRRYDGVTQGTAIPRPKGVVGYLGAHSRIVKAHGSASGHACIDCDQPARDWSYNGNCDAAIAETVGRFAGVHYCLHLEHYQPRCKPCHSRYDRRRP